MSPLDKSWKSFWPHLPLLPVLCFRDLCLLVTAQWVAWVLVPRERILLSGYTVRIPSNFKLQLLPTCSHVYPGDFQVMCTPLPNLNGKWASTVAMAWIWPFITTPMSSWWPRAQSTQGWVWFTPAEEWRRLVKVLSEGVGSLEGTVDDNDNDTDCSGRGCSLSANPSSYMFPQKERSFRIIWSYFQMGWSYSMKVLDLGGSSGIR